MTPELSRRVGKVMSLINVYHPQVSSEMLKIVESVESFDEFPEHLKKVVLEMEAKIANRKGL